MSQDDSEGVQPGTVRKQSMLYELCPVCGGEEGMLRCRVCKMRGVVETGATAAQLESLVKLDKLRQEAGITAAMLRTGIAKGLGKEVVRLTAELEDTAHKLSDIWIHLDSWARGEAPNAAFIQEAAASILRHQKAPGWK